MRRAQRKINQVSKIDYGIILSVLILALIGLVSVYATTVMIEGKTIVPTLFHALWYGVGAIVIIVLIQLDNKQLWRLAPILYGIGLVLLILVLFFYDQEVASKSGARSWFRIGSLSFQPSEVFKPAYILLLARLITKHNQEHQQRTLKTDWILIGKALAITAVPAALILRQNDLGTMLVILAILAAMILMSGVSWKILGPIIIIVLAFGGGIIYLTMNHRDFLLSTGILQPYQLERIDIWLDPFGDGQGKSYQLVQSLKAIGSGQMFGKGIGQSDVTVPVRESDFIFATIAENTGFLGSSFLLVVYFMLIYQMVQTCFKVRNEFNTYIATGVIAMILFHVLENVGMNIGLLPITGVPLPFISQGGSALLSNMIGVGLVLSMGYHHQSYRFGQETDFM